MLRFWKQLMSHYPSWIYFIKQLIDNKLNNYWLWQGDIKYLGSKYFDFWCEDFVKIPRMLKWTLRQYLSYLSSIILELISKILKENMISEYFVET